MMRISTRGRYALRAMVDIAQHAGQGPVARQEIAERQEISADYVAQLFTHLQAAGLVRGVKGPGGGYRLLRDAALISAGDVIRAVDGPIALVDCTLADPEGTEACPRLGICSTHLLWVRLAEAMAAVLDSTSLQDLCAEPANLPAGL